jgi:hypothetical protein
MNVANLLLLQSVQTLYLFNVRTFYSNLKISNRVQIMLLYIYIYRDTNVANLLLLQSVQALFLFNVRTIYSNIKISIRVQIMLLYEYIYRVI